MTQGEINFNCFECATIITELSTRLDISTTALREDPDGAFMQLKRSLVSCVKITPREATAAANILQFIYNASKAGASEVRREIPKTFDDDCADDSPDNASYTGKDLAAAMELGSKARELGFEAFIPLGEMDVFVFKRKSCSDTSILKLSISHLRLARAILDLIDA